MEVEEIEDAVPYITRCVSDQLHRVANWFADAGDRSFPCSAHFEESYSFSRRSVTDADLRVSIQRVQRSSAARAINVFFCLSTALRAVRCVASKLEIGQQRIQVPGCRRRRTDRWRCCFPAERGGR
jgi:hypothetical protein